jgi:hypothetical protein
MRFFHSHLSTLRLISGERRSENNFGRERRQVLCAPKGIRDFNELLQRNLLAIVDVGCRRSRRLVSRCNSAAPKIFHDFCARHGDGGWKLRNLSAFAEVLRNCLRRIRAQTRTAFLPPLLSRQPKRQQQTSHRNKMSAFVRNRPMKRARRSPSPFGNPTAQPTRTRRHRYHD